MNHQTTPNTPRPLALRPRDAANALGIGQRKHWQMTQPRGPIPCVKVGVCVVYPVKLLEAWLAEQASAASGAKSTGGAA
jgi:hypothetical protein